MMQRIMRGAVILASVGSIGMTAVPGQAVEWPDRWMAILEESRERLEAGQSDAARPDLSRLLRDGDTCSDEQRAR